MSCFQVRSELFPVGQNVGARQRSSSGARSFPEGRLRPRAIGCFACVRLAGEDRESSDTSAAIVRNCLEDCLQDSLFGSTENAEVKWRSTGS
jgi:hypothetical protein